VPYFLFFFFAFFSFFSFLDEFLVGFIGFLLLTLKDYVVTLNYYYYLNIV